ncbi:MAG TPA: O-antigen ligase family protein [Bryobacteraceae bacterium]|nr:O-antigen ligase family protein [Bryobacteraceae bacterium]
MEYNRRLAIGYHDTLQGSDLLVAVGRVIDRFAFSLTWLFLFTIPWENELQLADGITLSRWVGILACGATLLSVASNRRFRRPATIHWMIAAWVIWSALTYFWSISPGATGERISTYAQLLAMIWLIWQNASTPGRKAALLAAYILGTCVSSGDTVQNYFRGKTIERQVDVDGTPIIPIETRYVANGSNANELGMMIALSIPMTCYLLTQRKHVFISLLLWLQIPLALIGILLTGSRGALITTGVAFLIFPFSLRRLPGWQKYFSLLLLVVLVIWAVWWVPQPVLERFTTIKSELEGGTLTNRTFIWAAGLEVFREHPLLGVGSGAFGQSVLNQLDIPYVAHNTFLSVLVETGMVGAGIFLSLLASLFLGALHLRGMERALWVVLLLAWAVAGSSITWEYVKTTWFVFGLLAAFIGSREYDTLAEPKRAYPWLGRKRVNEFVY